MALGVDASATLSIWCGDAMKVASKRNFIRDESGGPLAEMAVLLLPMTLMIAMVIEGGNLLWRHQTSLKAARDVTRYLSRVPLLFDASCNLDLGVFTTASTAAKTLGISGLLAGGQPLIPNWTVNDIEVSIPTIVTNDPCHAIVQGTANVDLPLPFAGIFQLVDPDQSDIISFSVADRARWLGE